MASTETLRGAARTVTATLARDEQLVPDPWDVLQATGGSVSRDYEPATGADAVPPLRVAEVHAVPELVLSQFEAARRADADVRCFMGLLGPLGRAWMAVGRKLYVWDYAGSRDFQCFDGEAGGRVGGSEDGPLGGPIVDVVAVRPRPGVFVSAVEHVLALVTPGEVVLVAATLGAGPSGELGLHRTALRFATDGVCVLSLAASRTGRLFAGGQDGALYELAYQAEDGWLTRRCRVHNRSGGAAAYVAPLLVRRALGALTGGSVSGGAYGSPIVSLDADAGRGLLFALREDSALEAWALGADDAGLVHLGGVPAPGDAAVRLAGASLAAGALRDTRVVALSAVGAEDSAFVNAVATTACGTRLYVTVLSRDERAWARSQLLAPSVSYGSHGSYGAPEIVHVRLPAEHDAGSAGGAARVRRIVQAWAPAVHSALQRAGVHVYALSMGAEEDALGAAVANDARACGGAGAAERSVSPEALPLEGKVWALCEESRPGADPRGSLAHSAAYRDAVSPVALGPRRFVVLTHAAAHVLVRGTPRDELRGVLRASGGAVETSAGVVRFFATHSPDQAAFHAFSLACEPHADVLGAWALHAAVCHAGRPFFLSRNGPFLSQNGPFSSQNGPFLSQNNPFSSQNGPTDRLTGTAPISGFYNPSGVYNPSINAHPGGSAQSGFCNFDGAMNTRSVDRCKEGRSVFGAAAEGPQGVPLAASLRALGAEGDFEFSPLHRGVHMFFARLVAPFWSLPLHRVGAPPQSTLLALHAMGVVICENAPLLARTGMQPALSDAHALTGTDAPLQALSRALAAEAAALDALRALADATLQLLAFLAVCRDYGAFADVGPGAHTDTLDFWDALTTPRGRALVADVGTAVVQRLLAQRAPVEPLCAVLVQRSPLFFGATDVLLFQGAECTERAAAAYAAGDAPEAERRLAESLHMAVGAIDALSLDARESTAPESTAPESTARVPAAALLRIAERYARLAFYPGAVDVCVAGLSLASRGDPPGAPLSADGAAFVEGVLRALRVVHGAEDAPPLLPGVPPPDPDDLRRHTLARALRSPDRRLHEALYAWLLRAGLAHVLLDVDSPHVDAFLARAAACTFPTDAPEGAPDGALADAQARVAAASRDLHWRYLARRGRSLEAARVLAALASARDVRLDVGERLERLSLALAHARSACASGPSNNLPNALSNNLSNVLSNGQSNAPFNGQSNTPFNGQYNAPELVAELEERIDVARLQQRVLAQCRQTHGETAEARELAHGPLLSLTHLFNAYARPLRLDDAALCIVHAASYRDPILVHGLWSSLLERAHAAAPAGSGTAARFAAVGRAVADVAGAVYPSAAAFPLAFVLDWVLQRAIGEDAAHAVSLAMLAIPVRTGASSQGPIPAADVADEAAALLRSQAGFWRRPENRAILAAFAARVDSPTHS